MQAAPSHPLEPEAEPQLRLLPGQVQSNSFSFVYVSPRLAAFMRGEPCIHFRQCMSGDAECDHQLATRFFAAAAFFHLMAPNQRAAHRAGQHYDCSRTLPPPNRRIARPWLTAPPNLFHHAALEPRGRRPPLERLPQFPLKIVVAVDLGLVDVRLKLHG